MKHEARELSRRVRSIGDRWNDLFVAGTHRYDMKVDDDGSFTRRFVPA